MDTFSFKEWMITLRESAETNQVELSQSDNDYRHYFDQGYTPRGVLLDLVGFE